MANIGPNKVEEYSSTILSFRTNSRRFQAYKATGVVEIVKASIHWGISHFTAPTSTLLLYIRLYQCADSLISIKGKNRF